jgi:uncharacterized protein (TIGR02145 family)
MKTNFFRNNAFVKAGALVNRFLGKLGMTVLLCSPVVLSAQNGVTVSNLNVNTGTVTFDVRWGDKLLPDVWSDTVWVFVDYNAGGMMKRLPLRIGSSLTVTSADGEGQVIEVPGNDQGVWVVGNAKSAGSFSASVALYYNSATTVIGACVYASNYPPVAEYVDGKIKFTGTPMYKIVFKGTDGNLFDGVSEGTYTILAGETVDSFTDKTGAPGIMKCVPPATYTLIASAAGFCDSGAGVTFALSDTEDDVNYRLYWGSDPVGTVLAGTGSAQTFSGSFNMVGTYTARTVADGLTCPIAMSGSHVIVKNPLPDNPDVTGDSRNCPGTVTLNASSSGAVIDWYADVDEISTLYTGASYTPEIATSTTYYVQARVENTGCLSARVAVVAEVDMAGCCDAPGATVNFTAFNPCTYSPSGSTWSLADTREETYGNSQTYTVKLMADSRYWMVQDMKFGNKCDKTTYTGSTSVQTGKLTDLTDKTYYGDCSNARTSETPAARGYFYDWAATMNHANAFQGGSYRGCTGAISGYSNTIQHPCQGICPAGWHVPTGRTGGDLVNLYTALEGKNLSSTLAAVIDNFGLKVVPQIYDVDPKHFHAVHGGCMSSGNSYGYIDRGHYTTSSSDADANSWMLRLITCCIDIYSEGRSWAWQLRCVKNY